MSHIGPGEIALRPVERVLLARLFFADGIRNLIAGFGAEARHITLSGAHRTRTKQQEAAEHIFMMASVSLNLSLFQLEYDLSALFKLISHHWLISSRVR